MKKEKSIMGMIVVIDIADNVVDESIFDKVFSYFSYVEEKFSPFKENSELSKINRGEISEKDFSEDMKEVFRLSDDTKKITNGYFDIVTLDGKYNTSGMVKGWAIFKASEIMKKEGYKNFIVEAGGDIQACGKNSLGKPWSVGISSPFRPGKEIIKVLSVSDKGVATSGTYAKGDHIYDPVAKKELKSSVVSLTVVGPNIYEADRFATAAFAMGENGIDFIENYEGIEGYSINSDGIATMTSNFYKYISNNK